VKVRRRGGRLSKLSRTPQGAFSVTERCKLAMHPGEQILAWPGQVPGTDHIQKVLYF
jgi:hypothetical protein